MSVINNTLWSAVNNNIRRNVADHQADWPWNDSASHAKPYKQQSYNLRVITGNRIKLFD